MNVRDFARLTAREMRGDEIFWDDLVEGVASRTVDRLRTLPPLQRRAYTVNETADILGLGRSAVRNAIARGELRAVRIGGRVIIPLSAVAKLLGDDLVLQFDGTMEVDQDLISSIAEVAADVEAGRSNVTPPAPTGSSSQESSPRSGNRDEDPLGGAATTWAEPVPLDALACVGTGRLARRGAPDQRIRRRRGGAPTATPTRSSEHTRRSAFARPHRRGSDGGD